MLRSLIGRLLPLILLFSVSGSLSVVCAAPWLPFGPDGGDARRVEIDPTDHAHMYLGAANGWIYESHNSGAGWRRVAQIGKRDDLVIRSIWVDPSNARHLVVGAWGLGKPDGGIFLSYDGGSTWQNQAEMRGQSVRSLAAAPSNPKVLIAGSLQGVFRSTDGGQRWTRISPVDSTEIHEVESVAIDPVDPNIIYAGTWHLPWKTVDGGEHWENIKDGIIDDSDVFSIIVDPKDSKIVYASACSGIYKSEDAGTLFHKIQGIPSAARRTRILIQDPQNLDIVFAGTTEGLFRSVDAGKTWARTTGPEIIVLDVKIDLNDSRHVLIATERSGVLSSDDGGDTFHPSNGGFSARQVTSFNRDTQHPAVVYVGVVNDKEWGGVFRSENGGLNWKQQSDGLQGRDVFALGQAPDGAIFAGTSHGLFRLATGEETWKRMDDDVVVAAVAASPPPESARPEPAAVRAPVPLGRNHFAETRAFKHMTSAQRRAGLAKSKAKPRPASKGKGKTKAGVRSSAKTKAKAGAKAKQKSGSKALTPTLRRAQRLAARKATSTRGKIVTRPRVIVHNETALPSHTVAISPPVASPTVQHGFDGSVYGIVTSGRTVLAITSAGLMATADDGATWALTGPEGSESWRLLAGAKRNVVAASLSEVFFSSNAGTTWVGVKLPENLARLAAVAVEPNGNIWVGGREGVFVSGDGGSSWSTPKNLYVNSVSSLFYDETNDRIILTTGGYSGVVFSVQLPQRTVTYADTGWMLRFARPVGDHLVAATLFDGIVIQPKMIAASAATPDSAPSK